MSATDKSARNSAGKVKSATREERLAEALRANLKKRRTQTHSRKEIKPTPEAS